MVPLCHGLENVFKYGRCGTGLGGLSGSALIRRCVLVIQLGIPDLW